MINKQEKNAKSNKTLFWGCWFICRLLLFALGGGWGCSWNL